MWKHSCSPMKPLLFFTLAREGLINMSIKQHSNAAIYACKVGHTFYHCSREREANVLDHKGCNSNGTNQERCLLMRLKHQPKQNLDGGTIFMRGCLAVLSCPPRHLSHHHSITVCLHYLRSWMNRGSGLSLGSSGGPALPCPPTPPPSLSTLPPPTTPPQHIHLHTNTESRGATTSPLSHTHQVKPWERVLVLSASYLWQILRPSEAGSLHHQLFSKQRCCTSAMRAPVDL